MAKCVTFTYNTLLVSTRLLEEHRDNMSKVIVTCKGETALPFYRCREQAFNDPDYLKNIRLVGYSVNDLILVAQMLKDQKITDINFNNYMDGFKDGYSRATTDFNNSIQDCVKKIINGG